MPIKKDKKQKKIVVKKTAKKGKTSQTQSITVNINKGKSTAKQPSGKPTIASSITSLANVIRSSDFYRPTETPTPVAPVGVVREPIKTSVSTQISQPVQKSIAVQSEEPVAMKVPMQKPIALKPGKFNIPSGEPVNLKLPPQRRQSPLKRLVQNVELGRMAQEEKLSRENLRQGPSLKPRYEGTSSEVTTIKKPVKDFGVGISDVMSDVSTTPLYEGGREVPEPPMKRSYVKSGRYSKKQPKQPTLIPVITGEGESFYPTKQSPQVQISYALDESQQI